LAAAVGFFGVPVHLDVTAKKAIYVLQFVLITAKSAKIGGFSEGKGSTTMTNTTTSSHNARLGAGELQRLLQIDGRLFETTAATPCRINYGSGHDLWFSRFRDRERAAKQCMACPFVGRCGYNAVASRATHGVWGGQVLPGDFPSLLEPIYERLLQQFETRRGVELGDAPDPALPGVDARRRQRAAA